MFRSILAVVAGIVVLTIVSFAIEAAADPLLMHMFPAALPDAAALAQSSSARLFMLAYTTFSIAVGGYVTAFIARRSRLTHAATMGAIEVAFTLYVMIAAPFPEAHSAPRWGGIVGIILMIPAACLGAAIQIKQTQKTVPDSVANLQ
ncbi:MAG: hypothetical protein ABSD67_08545 [Terracidiphilus sp.]|jgi:hypothetical protein